MSSRQEVNKQSFTGSCECDRQNYKKDRKDIWRQRCYFLSNENNLQIIFKASNKSLSFPFLELDYVFGLLRFPYFTQCLTQFFQCYVDNPSVTSCVRNLSALLQNVSGVATSVIT